MSALPDAREPKTDDSGVKVRLESFIVSNTPSHIMQMLRNMHNPG